MILQIRKKRVSYAPYNNQVQSLKEQIDGIEQATVHKFQGKEKETEPDFVLTYAENQAEDYPTTQGADKFAELVKEKTEGKVEILVNAGGSLGDENLSLNSCSLVVLILPEYPFLR